MNSEVHEVGVPKLDTPSREWRSHERIRTIHPRRKGGRDLDDLVNSGVCRVNAQVFGVKSRETRGCEAAKW
jgi:hypothetical protein